MQRTARQIQLIGNPTGGSEGAGTRRWAVELLRDGHYRPTDDPSLAKEPDSAADSSAATAFALECSTFNGSGEVSHVLSDLSRSEMAALYGFLYRRAGGLSRTVCAWYWTLALAVISVGVFCFLPWPSLAGECRRARTVRILDRVAAFGFRMGGLRVDGRVPFRLGCARWTPTGRQREEGRWSGDGSSPGQPVGKSTYDPRDRWHR